MTDTSNMSVFVCPRCANESFIQLNVNAAICPACETSFGFYSCPDCQAPHAISAGSAARCRNCGQILRVYMGLPPTQYYELIGNDPAAPGEAKEAPAGPRAILMVTTNEIAGYRIEKVFGDVFGLTVRVRNVFSNVGAHFRTIIGGEVAGYTKLLMDSRNEARQRLMAEARAIGANAVVAMRFDCNEIGDIMTEIAVYGTAVWVVPFDVMEAAEHPNDSAS